VAKFYSVKEWAKARRRNMKKYVSKNLKEPSKTAKYALRRARTLVPKDTGSLLQAIDVKDFKKGKNAQSLLFVRSATNPKYRGRYARVPRYAAIQHKLGRHSKYQAKTGDPHWAFTVRREVEKKTGKRLNLHIQQFASK
jgi:hypothetical protein